MSSEAAIFAIVKSLFDADSGPGGLQNSNSLNAAYVRGGLWRMRMPEDTFALPYLVCESFDAEQDTQGKARVRCLIRLHLFTDANLSYLTVVGNQNNIASRIRTVYHRATPSASNGWNPSIIRRIRSFQAAQEQDKNHQVHEFEMFMQRAAF